jgi:hypothetical protein
MKVLLNCDDVLESLTGQCDAAGDETALQEHLETCASCRHLADAVAPALNLFQEVDAASPADADLANRVWNRVEAEQHEVVCRAQARGFLSLGLHAWSQLGAAAAILLALGTLFWAVGPRDGSASAEQALLPPFSASLSRASMPEAHGLLHLASLRLPEACLTPASPPQAAHSLQCCTRCHHAGDHLPAARIVAFSQATCAACHKS